MSQRHPAAVNRCGLLQDEHAIAVREEAVTLVDGVGVGGEGFFSALVSQEGADQHQEGGLREVEVGEEAVDEAELVAGRYKDAGGVGVRGLGFLWRRSAPGCGWRWCRRRQCGGFRPGRGAMASAVRGGRV